MVRQACLGGDGAHGPVPGDVPLVEVTGHVGKAEPAQCRPPASVPPLVLQRAHGRRGLGIDVAEVPRQPVFVQTGLAADRRQAGTVGGTRQHQGADVGVPGPASRRRGHLGQAPPRALRVRLGHRDGRHRGQRPQGLPAALLGDGAASRRRGGVTGELAGPGPVPPGGASLADRGVEDQAGGERGRPEFAGLRALEGLAAFQPERLAVRLLGPAVRLEVGRDRAQLPAAQVADHQRAVDDDHLADRRVAGRAVGQHVGDGADRVAGQPHGARARPAVPRRARTRRRRLRPGQTRVVRMADHIDRHDRPLEKPASHTETTSVTGEAASGPAPARRQATALPEPGR